MLNAHIDRQSAIPWWAAFGAPLLVVPLMVALLAIWSPRHGTNEAVGSEVGVRSGQVQVPETSAAKLPSERMELIVKSRS